jgi:hypothetical protein
MLLTILMSGDQWFKQIEDRRSTRQETVNKSRIKKTG